MICPEPNRAYEILYRMISTDQISCEVFGPLRPERRHVIHIIHTYIYIYIYIYILVVLKYQIGEALSKYNMPTR